MTDAPHWTEPGAHPVADGVHRIPLPLPMDGLRAVNVYALETDDGLTLVDGGWAIPESRRRSSDAAEGDRPPARATSRRFLVTHVHRDHYTQAVAVRREFGSHVSLGIGDKPTLDLVHDDAADGDPTVARLAPRRRRASSPTAGGATSARPPDLGALGLPRQLARGRPPLEVGARTLDAVLHARAHAGPLRLRRPRRPGCSSPATTCCRRSRRRSASSRRTPTSRCATSWPRSPRSARCPTCGCCPRTDR